MRLLLITYFAMLTFNSPSVVNGNEVYFYFESEAGDRAAFDAALGQWESLGGVEWHEVQDRERATLVVKSTYRPDLWWAGAYSTRGILRMNYAYPGLYTIDRCVYAHELGHAIGLEHRDDRPSIMATSLGSNPCRITGHDRHIYERMYLRD